jgi:hypothetical protein
MPSDETRRGVLSVLDQLYLPAELDDVALCARVDSGLEVDAGALAELAAADREEFLSGIERAVWICPALEYSDGQPNDEFITRSDWPLRARLVEGILSETQELMLLRQLCDIAIVAAERGIRSAEDYARLIARIEDLTIQLPTARLREMRARRTIPMDDISLYRELAEDLYSERVKEERAVKQHAVAALEHLSIAEKYFGTQ